MELKKEVELLERKVELLKMQLELMQRIKLCEIPYIPYYPSYPAYPTPWRYPDYPSWTSSGTGADTVPETITCPTSIRFGIT